MIEVSSTINKNVYEFFMNIPITVLIDEGRSSIGKPTGIGLQAINLHKHLKKYCNCKISDYKAMKILPKGIRKFSLDALVNILALFQKYDIVHYQDNFVPFLKGKSKKIVTVHDLGVFLFPKTVPFIYVRYHQHSIRKVSQRADCIINPSEAIRNEFLKMFPNTNPAQVICCNDGIRDIFWNFKGSEKVLLEKFNIQPYTYFFFLGNLSRRKNLKFTLEAFIEAKSENLIQKNTIMVLGGQKWWGASDFKHLLRDELGIRTLGYLTDEDIVTLYTYSKSFVFPSLYEGFGMPIIEAMSQKTPIIISNIPTNMELNSKHNNQMFCFELNDKLSLIEKFVELDKNHLSVRESLNYGDISMYNFDNIAKEHLKIYYKVLKGTI